MLEVAKNLTSNYDDPATGQYGVMTGFGPEDVTWLWGDDLWPPDATKTSVAKTVNLDHPAVQEAYQAVADLVCKYKVAPDPSISQALSAAGDPFQAGKVAMNISGGWGFWSLKEAAGTFKWGAAALPRAKKGVMKDALYADPMLISSQTKLKEQAWEFVKYLYSEDGMRKFVVATWSPPSRQALLTDWVNLWPEGLRQELTESLQGSWKYGEVTPWNRIAGYSMFYDKLMAEMVGGGSPVGLCEKTAAEAAPVAKQKVEEVLATLKFE
jgi:multiple sugar transport system substrate-binding protein